jgi:hypothetical protein
MKKTIILLALVITSVASYSQEFMGVKVDGTKESVVAKYKAKGFKISIPPSETAVTMEGMVDGNKVELLIVSTPITHKVWQIQVYLEKDYTWGDIKNRYEKYLALLTEKYGTPTDSFKFFKDPYYEGDGYEMSAIKNEKVFYSTFWGNVNLNISEWQQVCIRYENPVNAELYTKEKNTINKTIY